MNIAGLAAFGAAAQTDGSAAAASALPGFAEAIASRFAGGATPAPTAAGAFAAPSLKTVPSLDLLAAAPIAPTAPVAGPAQAQTIAALPALDPAILLSSAASPASPPTDQAVQTPALPGAAQAPVAADIKPNMLASVSSQALLSGDPQATARTPQLSADIAPEPLPQPASGNLPQAARPAEGPEAQSNPAAPAAAKAATAAAPAEPELVPTVLAEATDIIHVPQPKAEATPVPAEVTRDELRSAGADKAASPPAPSPSPTEAQPSGKIDGSVVDATTAKQPKADADPALPQQPVLASATPAKPLPAAAQVPADVEPAQIPAAGEEAVAVQVSTPAPPETGTDKTASAQPQRSAAPAKAEEAGPAPQVILAAGEATSRPAAVVGRTVGATAEKTGTSGPRRGDSKSDEEQAPLDSTALAQAPMQPDPNAAAQVAPRAHQEHHQPVKTGVGDAPRFAEAAPIQGAQRSTPEGAAPAGPAEFSAATSASTASVEAPRHAAAPAGFAAMVDGNAAVPGQVAAPATAAAAPAAVRDEATPTVSGRAGQIGRELGVEIAHRVSAGRDELVVKLDPQHLGRIEVRMAFDDGGTLRAVVQADSPAALELLRRDSADLTRSLADAGVRADSQSFRFDGRGSSDGGQPRQQQPQRTPDSFTDAGTGVAAEDVPELRRVRSSGTVDLLA